MKLIFSLVFLLLNLTAFAQQAPAVNAEAQGEASAAELYTDGYYLEAAEQYEKQVQAEPKNPYAYYNLANSYFKAGDPDKAIINYYRAFRLLPRDKDIKANLSFVLSSTAQQFRDDDIPSVIFNLYYLFSSSELRGLSIALGWIAAVFFAVWMVGCKKSFSRKMFIYTLGLTIFFGLWYFVRLPYDKEPLAVTVVARAEVRSGPGDTFPVSVSIPKAHLVTITDTKGDWAQIKVKSENAEGWVLLKSIEEI